MGKSAKSEKCSGHDYMHWPEDFVASLGAKRPAVVRSLKRAEDQREVSISPEMARASVGLGEEKKTDLYS